jgi:hypothetical protein
MQETVWGAEPGLAGSSTQSESADYADSIKTGIGESGMLENEVWALSSVEARLGETRARTAFFTGHLARHKFFEGLRKPPLLHCPTTRNQIDYQDDQREHEQQVDESTHRVT